MKCFPVNGGSAKSEVGEPTFLAKRARPSVTIAQSVAGPEFSDLNVVFYALVYGA